MGNAEDRPGIIVDRDDERGILFFRVPEGVSTGDLLRTLSGLISQAREKKQTKVIIDFTAIQEAATGSFDEMRKVSGFVEGIQDSRTGARWAFVAPTDVAFGLARMFENLTTGLKIDVMVFRSEEPALRWLDMPDK